MRADPRRQPASRSRRDRGLTLPELLIAVSLMGVIAAVLSAAISVTYRQARSTEGRANVARSESALDTWLPADLASTDVKDTTLPAVDLNPASTPCGGSCGGIDLNGSNALQLAWRDEGVVTRVQYQYIQVAGEWQLRRIACTGGSCRVNVVLHDLDGPPDPATYTPGSTRPTWVMDVATPTDPASLNLSDEARSVVVTIDGGGDVAGAGGGANSISLTAGGRTTGLIGVDDFTVPSFVRARSRCGGPVTLIVDDSGSINFGGDNMSNVVKPGVRAFVEAFRGTPTKLQIVRFDNNATVLGPSSPSTTANGGWHRYIDMTNEADVTALLAAVGGLSADYQTNWEDAFFRTLKEQNGSPAVIVPNRIVFFTDGVPSVNRASENGTWQSYNRNGAQINYNAGVYNRTVGWRGEDGTFHQESYDRADVLLDAHRSVDMIFVGVGGGLQSDNAWQYKAAASSNPNVTPPAAVNRKGDQILAYLLTNAPGSDPSGEVRATYDAGSKSYTNAETADFYVQTSFDQDAFAAAMRAAALKDCGGTLTIQTRLTDGTPVGEEVVYENSAYRDHTGADLGAAPRRVTTSSTFRTGTFDFEISDVSRWFTVDVVPSELQTLSTLNFVSWSCRAGATPKTTTAIPIASSSFKGMSVQVLPNEALSCIMTVSR